MAQPIEIFCCFTEADAQFLVKLKDHFARHTPPVTFWDRSQIPGGANTQEEIRRHLNSAPFFLMLLSAQFLGNNYCYNTMNLALNQRKHIIPVLARPVDLSQLPIQHLQILPRDHQPISTRQDQDLVLLEVAREISRAIQTPGTPAPVSSAYPGTSSLASSGDLSAGSFPPAYKAPQQQPPLSTPIAPVDRSPIRPSYQPQQRYASLKSPSREQRFPGILLTRRKAILGLVAAAGIAVFGIEIYKHFTDPIYTADWSNGLNGWVDLSGTSSSTSEWQVVEGMLVSSNNNAPNNNGLITCPFSPPSSNYAVEVSTELIKENSNGYPSSMGIFIRGDGNGKGYWLGYSTQIEYNSTYITGVSAQSTSANGGLQVLKAISSSLDNNKFHTWHVEAKDTTLTVLLDGSQELQTQDTNYVTGTQIGLFSQGDQVKVQSFKVYSL